MKPCLMKSKVINPYLTIGFSHRYQLGVSTFIFRGLRSEFFVLYYAPNFEKKLEGNIAFALSVCLSVCVCVCVLTFEWLMLGF